MAGQRTHCKRGHEFTPENTKWKTHTDGRRYRQCRTCSREYGREWQRKRYATNAVYREWRRSLSFERAREQGSVPHGPECGCASCLWQRVEAEPSPEVRNMMRNHRRRAIERELRNARERIDQRLSEQSGAPLGEAVGRVINEIGEQVWLGTESRMK